MRFHMYNQFLGTQLPVLNVKNMLGEDYGALVDHFGDVPAVFEAESELNEVAYNKAKQSLIVNKSGETYDVIVYTCDGVNPYVRGNYFINEGVGYLAINGVINHEEYDLSKMKMLGEVIGM